MISIIIPNRNNVALLGVTLRSLYEDIHDLPYKCEVIIADNSDAEIADHIKDKLITTKFGYKFLHYDTPGLFPAFDNAAKKAEGKYIIRLDSDMLAGKNMIKDMVDFMVQTKDKVGFAHAPVNFFTQTNAANQHEVSLEPGSRMCRWAGQSKTKRMMTYKGMPWICDKVWYNETLNGYGALSQHNLTPFGDPYIGIKAWMMGYPAWAIPCRGGIHMGRMDSSKPFDKFKANGHVGNYNSFMTACVTAEVLTDNPDWAASFIRVGKSDGDVETAVKNYYQANEESIKQIAADDKNHVRSNLKYPFEDLVKLKPWNNEKKTFYEKALPAWKKIAGKRSNSCIKQDDWSSLRNTIRRHKIKTVLEFGSGLSTILFSRLGLRVISYETDAEFMNKVKEVCKKVDFRVWDNKKDIKLHPADTPGLGFVDGIRPRFRQAEECKKHCKIIAVHDVGASSKGVPEKVLSDCREIGIRTKRLRIYEKLERLERPMVSVIISHRNDFPMLGITVRSVVEDCIDLDGFLEIVICDNSGAKEKENLKPVISPQFVKDGVVKIVHQDFPCLFTARENAIQTAKGKYILCLDSHMIVGKNMVRDLVNFMESAPDNIGFAHAPLMYVSQNESAKRHEFQTRKYYDKPSKLDGIKGMPWICKRDWWHEMGGYGTLAREKISWGGGDVYLALKPKVLGYENWAVPCRPGMHIGPYSKLDRKYYRYRMWGSSGTSKAWLGLLITSYVLGEDEYPNKITDLRLYHTKSFTQSDWDHVKKIAKTEREEIDKAKTTDLTTLIR